MLTLKTVIENIKNGASMSDIIEYISIWIEDVRTLADTIDTEFFIDGLPEAEKENTNEFFHRAISSYHALEMSIDWIQNAVDATGAYIFRKEQEERERLSVDEKTGEAAGDGGRSGRGFSSAEQDAESGPQDAAGEALPSV